MTTTQQPAAPVPGRPTPMTIDVSQTPRVPMGRLASVELRKAVDTRAGRWFTVAIVGLVFLVELIYVAASKDADKANLNDLLGVAGGVLGYFLPILIIMLVTSEASQRNGLITFTLEPHRPRVVVAKFIAGLVLAVGVMVVAAVVAVVMTLLGTALGGTADWSIQGHVIFNGFILVNLINVLTGFAIGMLVLNTAGAIVTYFAYSLILPIAVGVLSNLSSGFEKVAPWIEFNTAQSALFTGDGVPSAEQWAQIAVTGVIWLVIPLILGIGRLLRIEFK